jgi:hypothetical protein
MKNPPPEGSAGVSWESLLQASSPQRCHLWDLRSALFVGVVVCIAKIVERRKV